MLFVLPISFIFHMLKIIRERIYLFDYCQLCPFLIFSYCLYVTVYSFFNYNDLLVYPSIYGEKIREVATLSRLQHQHVVRYYQV